MFAYGSYNKTRQPLICNAFLIGIIDFIFSLIAGFGVWGGIGYLQKMNNVAYTQSSSVGLIFIAMPAAAVQSGNAGYLGLLMFTLWISGIDSAVGFVEGFVTNIVDATKLKRW
jgi:neurotransmitter:Na+ symporter, NSS family|tara:strand:+ start:138 stop:476 length:339 start_codon:yes stop_codon:yes gene_type:complete